MRGGERLDAGDVKRQLGERIELLAPQLLAGKPWRDGDLWRWGSLAGEEGQSLAVWVAGPKRGRWAEFNGGLRGDALDLVARTRFAGDLKAAFAWSLDWLGLGSLSAEERERQAERARQAAAMRDAEEARRRQARQQDAKAIWLAAAPLRPGDLVWRYLAGRAIDLGRLPRLPGALRCHPGLYHHKSGRYWPAMVAAFSGPDGQGGMAHVATQRTWLQVLGDGRVIKAPLGHDAKMTLGPFRHVGAAIHLTRGASGKPWQRAPEGEVVGFAEGIEDGLTFAVNRPDLRVACCATSLAYLARVALPIGAADVIVIGQNDPRGSDAMRAQAKGIDGLRARGYRVGVFRPPVFVKDLNDYAQWRRARESGAAAL
jgi:hypothetical protein